MTKLQNLTKGFFKENPIFVYLLGMCPSLAVTGSFETALGMGILVVFVLTLSNVAISVFRNLIPTEVRTPAYIVIIATFVTIVQMLTNAFALDLSIALGVFIPLIVVNCLILGRAEAFASKNGVARSALDGVGMGLGFTLGITLIAFFRELLGAGSITIWGDLSFQLIPEAYQISLLVQSAGAFLVFGILVSQINKIKMRRAERNEVA